MKFLPIAATAILATISPAVAQTFEQDTARAKELRQRIGGKITNERPRFHWINDGTHLWFRDQQVGGGHQIVLVDTSTGNRAPAFDHDTLAKALNLDPKNIDVRVIALGETTDTLELKIGGKSYIFDHKTGKISERGDLKTPDNKGNQRKSSGLGRQNFGSPSPHSPDKKHHLEIREHNLFIRSADGEPVPLTTDGTKENAYRANGFWSPDSSRVVTLRVRWAQQHPVHMVESSPKDQVQPKLFTHNYLKPGDQIEHQLPHLFDVIEKKEIPVEQGLFNNPWNNRHFHWALDGNRFRFVHNQRGHQVMRVVGIDPTTGEASPIIDEKSDSFIDYSQKHFFRFLKESNEIIWSSERDGWHHLYLYDADGGGLKNQITKGEWIVRKVESIDTEKRQVTFRAMGIFPEQDPYHVHFARIDFDGGNLVHLTEGDGTHEITYSSNGKTYIDTYSRVDLPPVYELRRTSDGKKLCDLTRADASQLAATGWRPPERFVAKGRDGKTDIYGIIVRPSNFDPQKSYPVIEKIYAGPHGHFVPKRFTPHFRMQDVAEHGFILVQIDGMGTNFRSKKFHDVCWQNLMDSGFPDRIAWLKAAAQKHSEFDLERVGIFGGSAGGQSTVAGMLNHPDFYKVGVSDCGCHDNRMDKIWWNEAWMGTMGDHYAANSNVTHAHKLRGKLLLTVGELDRNVDPASTMQVVNALIQADREFDMIVVPGAGHGIGESPYMSRRRTKYFREHLGSPRLR